MVTQRPSVMYWQCYDCGRRMYGVSLHDYDTTLYTHYVDAHPNLPTERRLLAFAAFYY